MSLMKVEKSGEEAVSNPKPHKSNDMTSRNIMFYEPRMERNGGSDTSMLENIFGWERGPFELSDGA